MSNFSGGRDISNLLGNGRRRFGVIVTDRYKRVGGSKKRQIECYIMVERAFRAKNVGYL